MINKYQIIIPEFSYIDENIDIEIVGVPDEELIMHLSTEDYYNINANLHEIGYGSKWESNISIVLDENGRRVLDATIFTTMSITNNKVNKLEYDLDKIQENRECHISIELIKNNVVVCKKIHERKYSDDNIVSEDIISDKLLARYFTKNDDKKHAAIIVVSGSDGRIEKAQAIAECLAIKGFSTLAVCYFDMNCVNKELDRVPMEYIGHAIEYLQKRKEVDSDKIGIYGRSKGGEMVLLASTLFSEIKYVVANTPSLYVQEGLIRGKGCSRHSSWCISGKEVPFVKVSLYNILRLLLGFIKKDQFVFRKYYDRVTWKKGKANNEEARIKIENSNAKFLLIGSDTDGIWPSDKYLKEACEVINDKNKCIGKCYKKSGHMLTLPYQPIPNCKQYGGEIESAVPATIECWNETVNFFKKMLNEQIRE